MAGKSPLTQTALRHMKNEVRSINGELTAVVLWDVKKFFDNLKVPTLVDRAVEAHFPLEQLALAMQQRRAPRIIRTEGFYGTALASPGVSVLPGCLTSVSLAKGYVNPILAAVPQDDDHENFNMWMICIRPSLLHPS